MSHHPKLALEEDMQFQQIEWRVQRVAWILWLLIIAAALAGLLGPGPLSNAKTTTPDGTLAVAYERFLHFHHPTRIEVLLHRAGNSATPAEIKFSQSLLDRFEVLRIEPEPEQHRLEPDGIVYIFQQTAGPGTGKVTFHVEYEKLGTARGTVTLLGHEPVAVSQFVYP